MTNAQSKCLPIKITCHEYVHPWTESCWNSAAGQILHSLGNSSKIYTIVYMLSLLMRGRIPTARDLQRTFLGIIQSTGFLVTNGCSYLIFACILRNLLGEFYFWTIAYAPAFLASLFGIIVERPTRRPLLCLYVANLATETIWRMTVSRNLVQPIKYGETLIFGLSTSVLLYLFKRGLHKNIAKDSLFNVLKFVVGNDEEGNKTNDRIENNIQNNNNNSNSSYQNQRRALLNNISNNNSNQNINNIDNNENNENNENDHNENDNNDNDDDDTYADANNGDNEINRDIELEQLQQQHEQQQVERRRRELDSPSDLLRRYNNIGYGNNDDDEEDDNQQQLSRNSNNRNGLNKFQLISNLLQIYENILKMVKTMPKHKSCPHSNGCLYYSLCGGLKLFGVGIGVQVALKLALQIQKVIQFKLKLRKTIFNEGTLKLGLFLGGFSFLYKASSCSLRHLFGKDDPLFALPAGLISSVAFTKYPDVTIALYVMWKMLQITYNMGIKAGYLPKVPGFTIFLYCASTATLFHAAALEPETLRPSYWKFLSSNSGGRVNHMDRRAFDVYGLNSHEQVMKIQKLTNTDNSKVSFALG
ncbi:transmembrane protein 135-like [Condylostylus longicornis]|uniref:transmembrane protein 135-like n=1 Tax=Condylostylus longicornis TaxID=2530218 RepID=UPI00244DA46E|nr:transmembrane protein 135-like [Condylostylus longicornis]XP_055384387.1 transmembrane protein 135-like [Condylostylus longicornis]XP_055384388.1 transmembrane protein 135-like [Condylostylus longicornis]XP_055384389.1 transmembrane protein 135-like [Condylostylus longicornis]XP_055384391.1 transmembrane protein 135-like [Condylostylus longicornis]XP_055384392.1 transmembrane protein 135-like [Condylostylus longicornis]